MGQCGWEYLQWASCYQFAQWAEWGWECSVESQEGGEQEEEQIEEESWWEGRSWEIKEPGEVSKAQTQIEKLCQKHRCKQEEKRKKTLTKIPQAEA